MKVETKNWKAQINRMPGDNFFSVVGIVTVQNSGVVPTLVVSSIQDKSFDLRLDLLLEGSGGINLPALTDKTVRFKVPGASSVTGVSILFDGELLHHIDEIMITD
ncbi:MAG: hypothetical protein V4749_05445 [Pseudomonadota bacterium]